MKHIKQRKICRIGILVVVSMVLLVSSDCRNTTEPEILADITAQNLCGAAVDVFFNGVYQFSLEHATDETIFDVPFGSYTLEAKKKGEEMLVFSGPIDIADSLTYIWVIEGPSVIIRILPLAHIIWVQPGPGTTSWSKNSPSKSRKSRSMHGLSKINKPFRKVSPQITQV